MYPRIEDIGRNEYAVLRRISGLSKVTILFTRREDAKNGRNGTLNKTGWAGRFFLGIIGTSVVMKVW